MFPFVPAPECACEGTRVDVVEYHGGLAADGFKNVYTITDGFAGDRVKDPESVFHGKRMRGGWKKSISWVYDIDPEKIILEEYASKQTQ